MAEAAHTNTTQAGATVVISHMIKPGMQAEYEQWINGIAIDSLAAQGVLDRQVVRPIAGLTTDYTVILRFSTHEDLQRWMSSPERAAHIEQVKPFLAKDDRFFVRSGLDFWFTPEGAKAKVPVRWKQFLVTWSAIVPLSLASGHLLMPLLHKAGLPVMLYSDAMIGAAAVVAMMVYVVMPRYTRLVQRWLFAH